MDTQTVTNKEIMDIAERKSGKEALLVYKPDGPCAWVTMDDGSTVIVYESDL